MPQNIHSLLNPPAPSLNSLINPCDEKQGIQLRNSSTLTIFISAPDRSLGQRGRIKCMMAAIILCRL